MRKKKHAAALIVVAAALAAAIPANAEPSQAGCQAYGEFVADTAQTLNGATPGGGGQFVSGAVAEAVDLRVGEGIATRQRRRASVRLRCCV